MTITALIVVFALAGILFLLAAIRRLRRLSPGDVRRLILTHRLSLRETT